MMPIFLLLFQDSFGMLRLSLTKQLGVLGHWASPLAFRFTLVPETWGCLTSGCQIILALMSKETGTNQQSWNQMNRLGSKFGLTRCTETSMKRKKERENFQSPDPTEIRLARFEWNIGIRFRGVELSLHLIFPLISSPQNRSALACIPEAHFNARALAWLFNYLDTLSQGTIKFKKIHQGQLRVVQSPVPQMNGEDVHFLLSWWTYRIFHFFSQIPYEPCYQNKICLQLSTWAACDLPEVRMPTDLRDFKRVKKKSMFQNWD